jgi:hypothetical protein
MLEFLTTVPNVLTLWRKGCHWFVSGLKCYKTDSFSEDEPRAHASNRCVSSFDQLTPLMVASPIFGICHNND